jgi:hypothetical protein
LRQRRGIEGRGLEGSVANSRIDGGTPVGHCVEDTVTIPFRSARAIAIAPVWPYGRNRKRNLFEVSIPITEKDTIAPNEVKLPIGKGNFAPTGAYAIPGSSNFEGTAIDR